jgi:hypothetical protein
MKQLKMAIAACCLFALAGCSCFSDCFCDPCSWGNKCNPCEKPCETKCDPCNRVPACEPGCNNYKPRCEAPRCEPCAPRCETPRCEPCAPKCEPCAPCAPKCPTKCPTRCS